MSEHPFLDPEFLPDWDRLTPDAVEPDLRLALTRARAAVDAVAANSEVPSYANTLAAFEQATEELHRAWTRVRHLLEVADSEALREAHGKVLGEVSDFESGLPLHEGLWHRLQAFAATPEAAGLTGARRRFLDETLAEFRQHGAELDSAAKQRLLAIDRELAEATKTYSEHTLDARNAWEFVVDDPARLAGLPDSAQAAALESARRKGHGTDAKPAWRFTLQNPSVQAVMTYADDEALRRSVWEASTAIGRVPPWSNLPLVQRILELRREKARLLGYAHFADFTTSRRMARSAQRAIDFEAELRARVATAFARENEELQAFIAAATHRPVGVLRPWEMAYWAEKQRRNLHDFDEEALRPYFPLESVIDGAYRIAERLFSIRITERTDLKGWHPDVKAYEVREAEGDRLRGVFYTDWHPRDTKSAGAWMNDLETGGPRADGSFNPHLGLICGNLTPPAGGKPSLLTHSEVETVFHELGHLLHHLLGEVEVKALNGVHVAWDFVELPSQILENWCWERESVDLFARHHATGATIPNDLWERLQSARNFRAATATVRQLLFGMTDLLLHTEDPSIVAGDVDAILRTRLGDYLPHTEPPLPTSIANFGHLFSDPMGYAGGYYSYKWAEVLDADAFSRFRTEGLLSAQVGGEFRHRVLARGNAAPPEQLFRDFMGRDPDPEALLVRCGLA